MTILKTLTRGFRAFALLLTAISVQASEILPLQNYEKDIILSVHGSNTLGARLVPSWAEQYLTALGLEGVQIRPTQVENEYHVSGSRNGRNYIIHIAAHGSSTGFRALNNGEAAIAMSSRPIKDSEVQALTDLGDMRSFEAEHVAAIDGLAVIVNSANPVKSLTIDEVAAVFSGRIQNWSQLGGDNRRISVYARDENSGTWDTFDSLVLKNQFKLNPNAKRYESNDQLSDLVASDLGGIGFVGLASVRNAKPLAIADGFTSPLRPQKLYVATEDYPLSRRLYLYLPTEAPHPRAADFIEFSHQAQAQQTVDRIGFVSLNPVSVKPGKHIDGPSLYVNLVQHGERLSVNFRFKEGSASLDNRAQRDVQRIADYLAQPQNKGKHVQLIGFGDLKQSEQRSVLLSKLRASAVQSALYKQGVSSLPVAGFGAYMPVASQDGDNRSKNQRVEVWVFDSDKEDMIKEIKERALTADAEDVAHYNF